MALRLCLLGVTTAWAKAAPSPNCFDNFDNFDECWEKVEEFCLNDHGEFEDCNKEVNEEVHKEDSHRKSRHCYANLRVCLIDEYSSEEKCLKMADQCYSDYKKEKECQNLLSFSRDS